MDERKTVYDQALERHQEFLRRQRSGKLLIRSEGREWEQNRQGLLKWYFQDGMEENTALRGWNVFVHRIGRQGGRHVHQGGTVIFVLEGKGYSIVDGKRVDWEAGDLIMLPIKPGGEEIVWKAEDLLMLPLRPEGVVFQHTNDSSEESASLLACEPNLIHALGVDRGSRWEQVEPAPE